MKPWVYGIIAAAALVSMLVAYQSSTLMETARDGITDEGNAERSEPRTQKECGGKALCIMGRVERIIDGDTLVIEGYKVRLSLVNTPEKDEPGFEEAKSFTSALCPVGSNAAVDQDDGQPLDRYNRVLGEVFCAGRSLNAELLHNGHAGILTRYCTQSEFAPGPWARDFGC